MGRCIAVPLPSPLFLRCFCLPATLQRVIKLSSGRACRTMSFIADAPFNASIDGLSKHVGLRTYAITDFVFRKRFFRDGKVYTTQNMMNF